MRTLKVFMILLLFLGAEALAEPFDKGGMRNLFDAMDAAINEGEGYSKQNNAAGNLAWAESYLLEAYLNMYEATKDGAYLKKFVRHADRVAGATDKAKGAKDHRGASLYGWSSTKYGKNREPVVYLVHSGMILFPMVRFAEMVKNDPTLSLHEETARRYVRLAETAVAEFDDTWGADPASGGGFYWSIADDPRKGKLRAPSALNVTLSLGRVIVVLYRITGKDAYLEKATGLAKYFKAGLRGGPDGIYVWGYQQDLKANPRYEDIAHGAIDVDFAYQAYRSGIVFTDEDMRRFSRTLIRAKKGSRYSEYVNGTSNREKPTDYSDSSGRWLELASCGCEIYESVSDYMSTRVERGKKEHPVVLLGVAKLLKYHDRCRPSEKTP
ncbi:MAG: hypothetical protein IH611_11650 [Deltaproteobacteria bacterium]|nr:hypothetical protein [Deltaproteobacteria bacterium]